MAIKYINVIRKIIGDKDKAVVDISKLGFFSYMMAKVEDKEELYAFVPESLQKLHQHDVEENGELIDTLECFLNHNQSIKKTSQLMFVHYRTVSYRIQKIVEITGMDFSNATEMLVVRNGLLVLRVLRKCNRLTNHVIMFMIWFFFCWWIHFKWNTYAKNMKNIAGLLH